MMVLLEVIRRLCMGHDQVSPLLPKDHSCDAYGESSQDVEAEILEDGRPVLENEIIICKGSQSHESGDDAEDHKIPNGSAASHPSFIVIIVTVAGATFADVDHEHDAVVGNKDKEGQAEGRRVCLVGGVKRKEDEYS